MNKTPFPELNEKIKQIELDELNSGSCYPCAIVMDRYTGSYSGAQWLAFNEDPGDIPDSIGGDDGEEDNFWHDHKQGKGDYLKPIGKGSNPNEAYADLIEKMKEYWNK